MSSTNPHLAQPVTEWGADGSSAAITVLAIHGRGQNPTFMVEQSARFGLDRVRFVAPRAADDCWYPKPFLEPLTENQPALDCALDTVDARLDDLIADGTCVEDIVCWGFSQGACLLAHHALTRPRRLGGLILFTGGYVGVSPVRGEPGSLRDVPIIVRSIENDPFVPPHRVQATVEALRFAGADVDDVIAPGDEHIITDEAIDTARELLGRSRSAPVGSRTT